MNNSPGEGEDKEVKAGEVRGGFGARSAFSNSDVSEEFLGERRTLVGFSVQYDQTAPLLVFAKQRTPRRRRRSKVRLSKTVTKRKRRMGRRMTEM